MRVRGRRERDSNVCHVCDFCMNKTTFADAAAVCEDNAVEGGKEENITHSKERKDSWKDWKSVSGGGGGGSTQTADL